MKQPRRVTPQTYRSTNPGTRPEAFWRTEPAVPESLRESPPHPDPRWLLDGRSEPDGYRVALERWDEHRTARRRWLLRGHR